MSFLIMFLCAVVFFLYIISRMRWENRLILRIGWKELDGFALSCQNGCPDVFSDDLIGQFRKRGSELDGLPPGVVMFGRGVDIFDFIVDEEDQLGCSWSIKDDNNRVFLKKNVVSVGYVQLIEDVARDLARSMGEHRAYLMRSRGPDHD